MLVQVAATSLNMISSEPDSSIDSRSSQTDISFDDKLRAEELKLSEKQKLLQSLPWTYLQGLMNSGELKFDFDFSSASINENLVNFDQKRPVMESHQPETRSPRPATDQTGNSGISPATSPAKLLYVVDQNSFIQNLMANSKYAMGNLPISFSLSGIQNVEGKSINLQLIVDELIDKIKLVKEGEKISLSLALKPEHLGEMLMNVSMRNGAIFVSIVANQETRDLIEANKAILEESFKRANINLGNLDVSSGGNSRETFASKIEMPEILRRVSPVQVKSETLKIIDPFLYSKFFGFQSNLIYSKA